MKKVRLAFTAFAVALVINANAQRADVHDQERVMNEYHEHFVREYNTEGGSTHVVIDRDGNRLTEKWVGEGGTKVTRVKEFNPQTHEIKVTDIIAYPDGRVERNGYPVNRSPDSEKNNGGNGGNHDGANHDGGNHDGGNGGNHEPNHEAKDNNHEVRDNNRADMAGDHAGGHH